jgi:hypothetical protein
MGHQRCSTILAGFLAEFRPGPAQGTGGGQRRTRRPVREDTGSGERRQATLGEEEDTDKALSDLAEECVNQDAQREAAE